MDILYLLIPLSVLLVLAVIAIFGWALQGGQFDELDREGERILEPEPAPVGPAIDLDQAAVTERAEQSRSIERRTQ